MKIRFASRTASDLAFRLDDTTPMERAFARQYVLDRLAGTALEEPVLVVGGCDETSSVWPDSSDKSIDINSTVFDGAKWSRRETPADPFEEVTT